MEHKRAIQHKLRTMIETRDPYDQLYTFTITSILGPLPSIVQRVLLFRSVSIAASSMLDVILGIYHRYLPRGFKPQKTVMMDEFFRPEEKSSLRDSSSDPSTSSFGHVNLSVEHPRFVNWERILEPKSPKTGFHSEGLEFLSLTYSAFPDPTTILVCRDEMSLLSLYLPNGWTYQKGVLKHFHLLSLNLFLSILTFGVKNEILRMYQHDVTNTRYLMFGCFDLSYYLLQLPSFSITSW